MKQYSAEWWGAQTGHAMAQIAAFTLATIVVHPAFGSKAVAAMFAVWVFVMARPWEKP